jgi:hypothetical protein
METQPYHGEITRANDEGMTREAIADMLESKGL